MSRAWIGREVLAEEQASPNYRFRQVRWRRTGEVRWEVLDASSDQIVLSDLADRDEALRVVKGLERVGQRLDRALPGHVSIH